MSPRTATSSFGFSGRVTSLSSPPPLLEGFPDMFVDFGRSKCSEFSSYKILEQNATEEEEEEEEDDEEREVLLLSEAVEIKPL